MADASQVWVLTVDDDRGNRAVAAAIDKDKLTSVMSAIMDEFDTNRELYRVYANAINQFVQENKMPTRQDARWGWYYSNPANCDEIRILFRKTVSYLNRSLVREERRRIASWCDNKHTSGLAVLEAHLGRKPTDFEIEYARDNTILERPKFNIFQVRLLD